MKSDFSVKHFHLTAVSRDTACFPGYFWYAAKVGDAHQIIWIIDKGTDPLYLWRIWSLNVLLKCRIIYFQVLSLASAVVEPDKHFAVCFCAEMLFC